MTRFYWTLCAALTVTAVALVVSASAQPLPGMPAPGAAPLPGLSLLPPPGAQVFEGFPPPPPPLAMGFAAPGFPPFPRPSGPWPHIVGGVSVGEICLDKVARQTALRAYLEERLNLNAQQLAAWQEFESAAKEGEGEERQDCAKLATKVDSQTIAQRMDNAEEMLSRRLNRMRKVGATLRKAIATLSPDQLRLFEQAMPSMAPRPPQPLGPPFP